MKLQAKLLVTGITTSEIAITIGDIPDKVVSEVKNHLKGLPKLSKVDPDDKKATLFVSVLLGVEQVVNINEMTSLKNCSKMQRFMAQVIEGMAKAHNS